MSSKLNPKYEKLFELLGLYAPAFPQPRIDLFEREMEKIIQEAIMVRSRDFLAVPDSQLECGASFKDDVYGLSRCSLQIGHDEPHREFRFGPDAVDRSKVTVVAE